MATKKDLNNIATTQTAKIFSSTKTAQPKKEKETSPKQVFSFRGKADSVKAWRLYATITGTKVDDLGSLAMQEYLTNHPLKGAEKALFDEKMNS